MNQHIRTDLTGGRIEGGERIAAWLDGTYDDIIVEWWELSGSFLRTVYNRGTTCTEYHWEPVGTEAWNRLAKMKGQTMNIIKQYFDAKRRHPDLILLFRVGDFYEAFDADASALGKLLGLTITTRDNGFGTMEMAGFPHQCLELYLRRLLQAGQRVAICDPVESVPVASERIAKAGVERVVIEPVPVRPTRFDLSELNNNPAKMIEWLGYDGNVPTVTISKDATYRRGYGYGHHEYETLPVTDTRTLAAFISAYRDELRDAWAKVNPHREPTHKQWLGKLLSELGIKGGSVAARLARAKAARPDLYSDVESKVPA